MISNVDAIVQSTASKAIFASPSKSPSPGGNSPWNIRLEAEFEKGFESSNSLSSTSPRNASAVLQDSRKARERVSALLSSSPEQEDVAKVQSSSAPPKSPSEVHLEAAKAEIHKLKARLAAQSMDMASLKAELDEERSKRKSMQRELHIRRARCSCHIAGVHDSAAAAAADAQLVGSMHM